ncbi:MAG: magnesium transporter, partial [Lachnospiraceae bacterium]|nr:magnesium transporter [Lachnospiraceae bacterium]
MSEIFDLSKIQEMIDSKQYAKLREHIEELNPADIAALFEELPGTEVAKIFRILPKEYAAEVFSHLPIEDEQAIIKVLTDKEAAYIIDNLYADDAADLIDEMPANVVKRILAQTDPETRRDINNLLKYPDDSAGSIMTVEYVDLKENITVDDAIKIIRRDGIDKETIDICYVLDAGRRLKGIVSLRKLLLSQPDELIGNIMDENVISINSLTDQEEAARMFQKYDFTTMPVVDSENRLVGIITIDDIVDILQQEATEDIEKMAGITPTDKPYLRTSVWETYRKRIPWLLLLMISATFTGKIITHFETALAAYVALTAFIPMLMDTGGNAGSQVSVTVIRGLSLDEIELRDIGRIIWKEMRVGLLIGVSLAVVNFIKIMVIDDVTVFAALSVCIAVAVTVVIAKIVGCVLPILAKRVGFDPAVMASPLITTIVDALSLLVFFNI